jgi:Xaa-Pro aminopeptidase
VGDLPSAAGSPAADAPASANPAVDTPPISTESSVDARAVSTDAAADAPPVATGRAVDAMALATAAPTPADLARWAAADREARPARLARVRQRLEEGGLDAYYGLSRENTRYLTGFDLREGEEKVAGQSGHFLVGHGEVVVFADSRYTEQAEEQCAGARIEAVYHDLAERWASLVASLRPLHPVRAGADSTRRVAVEAAYLSHATWSRLAEAAPQVELVPVEGWIEADRAVKDPSEVERIAAASSVADAALERLLPSIGPGVTEAELALQLDWEMRTGGAEALAFWPTCLSGPRAALPHGAAGARRLAPGEVVLFDFGAQVAGYRSDMTRTLFVAEPDPEDLAVYELVARAQQAAIEALRDAVRDGEVPTNRSIDARARAVIDAAGYGERFGHGLGHGIGLATHEPPSLSPRASEARLPVPTVFSVEPGVYLPGRTGVRIEDLVLFDPTAGRLELLTHFPREVTVVGG